MNNKMICKTDVVLSNAQKYKLIVKHKTKCNSKLLLLINELYLLESNKSSLGKSYNRLIENKLHKIFGFIMCYCCLFYHDEKIQKQYDILSSKLTYWQFDIYMKDFLTFLITKYII